MFDTLKRKMLYTLFIKDMGNRQWQVDTRSNHPLEINWANPIKKAQAETSYVACISDGKGHTVSLFSHYSPRSGAHVFTPMPLLTLHIILIKQFERQVVVKYRSSVWLNIYLYDKATISRHGVYFKYVIWHVKVYLKPSASIPYDDTGIHSTLKVLIKKFELSKKS